MLRQIECTEGEIVDLIKYIEKLAPDVKAAECEAEMVVHMQYWDKAFAEREVISMMTQKAIEATLLSNVNNIVLTRGGYEMHVEVYHAYNAALRQAKNLLERLERDLLAQQKEYRVARKAAKKERNNKT